MDICTHIHIYLWGKKETNLYVSSAWGYEYQGKNIGLLSKDSLKTPTICVCIFSFFFFCMSLELNPLSQVASENSTTEPPTYPGVSHVGLWLSWDLIFVLGFEILFLSLSTNQYIYSTLNLSVEKWHSRTKMSLRWQIIECSSCWRWRPWRFHVLTQE